MNMTVYALSSNLDIPLLDFKVANDCTYSCHYRGISLVQSRIDNLDTLCNVIHLSITDYLFSYCYL